MRTTNRQPGQVATGVFSVVLGIFATSMSIAHQTTQPSPSAVAIAKPEVEQSVEHDQACERNCAAARGEIDVDAIRASRMRSNQAIANHDVDAIQSFLDDDYVITISTGAIERSRDEHGRSFAAHFEEFPDVVYVRTPAEVVISDAYPLAMERGTWVGSRTTRNGQLESGGDYTAAWRKTGGVWKIYTELFVALYCHGEDC